MIDLHAARIMRKLIKRCEHMLDSYLSSSLMTGIRKALEALDLRGMLHSNNTEDDPEIYCSVAGGLNVSLTSHRDEDFFFSVVVLLAPPRDGTEEKYTMDDPVLAYFVFPEYNVSIPIRSGDTVIINSTEMHSISTRVLESDKFLCISLYLKSRIIGLNDNRIALTKALASLEDN